MRKTTAPPLFGCLIPRAAPQRQRLTRVPLCLWFRCSAPNSLISSLYLENPETLEVYQTRMMKDEGATITRVRWYGDLAADNSAEVAAKEFFIERKTHHTSWSGLESVKARGCSQPARPAFQSGPAPAAYWRCAQPASDAPHAVLRRCFPSPSVSVVSFAGAVPGPPQGRCAFPFRDPGH